MAKKYSVAINPEILKEIGANGIELTINSRAIRSICNCGNVLLKPRDEKLPETCPVCKNDLSEIKSFWINWDKEIGKDIDKGFYDIFSETLEDGNIHVYANLTKVIIDSFNGIAIAFKREKNTLLIYNPNLGDCAEAIVDFKTHYSSHEVDEMAKNLIPYLNGTAHPALLRLAKLMEVVSSEPVSYSRHEINLDKIDTILKYGYFNMGQIFNDFDAIKMYSTLISQNCRGNWRTSSKEYVKAKPINSIEELFDTFQIPYTLRSVYTDERYNKFHKDYYGGYNSDPWKQFKDVEDYPTEFKAWLAYYVNHEVFTAKTVNELLRVLPPKKEFDCEAIVNFIKKHKYFGDSIVSKLQTCLKVLEENKFPVNSQTLTFKNVNTFLNDKRFEGRAGASEVQICLFHSLLNGGDVLKALDALGI